jgi:hypothetical protein
MRLWPAFAAAAPLVLLACGQVPGTGVLPLVTPPAAALVPWEAFPADQIPRPVVLIGNASPASGFSTDGAKLAALCHKFRSAIKLSTVVPARAQATWTTGTSATYPAISAAAALAAMMKPPADNSDTGCSTAQPLVIDGSRFGVFDFETDRGTAQISAWLFTASGAIGEVAFPALATSALWNGGIVNGYTGGGSTVSADGYKITFTFYGAPSSAGPCGADYGSAVAESPTAVAVAVQAFPHASPGAPIACPAIAQERSVTVILASPLGGRVLVDASSAAVAVCPAAVVRPC